MKKEVAAISEIMIIVCAIFAFAYIFHESSYMAVSGDAEESRLIVKIRELVLGWLSKGIVSAQTQISISTCLVDIQGKKCQEYLSSECDSKCSEACIPVSSVAVSQCKTGTCIDKISGTCTPNSPKFFCEEGGAEWNENGINEIPECRQGCCLFGSNAQLATEQQCAIISEGNTFNFHADVNNEIQCIAMIDPDFEGACVSANPEREKNKCKFTTKKECANRQGQFYSGYLCSNPDLNTECERQKTTSCVEGKDGVYWIDSCGNRENIYESGSQAAKDRSWNNGKVMDLNDENVCELGAQGDPLGSAASCGNCNRFAGSVCSPASSKTTKPIDGNFVCRNLGCTDRWGNARQNGESWCVTEGQIGVDGEISPEQNFIEPPDVNLCGETPSGFGETSIGNLEWRNSINVRAIFLDSGDLKPGDFVYATADVFFASLDDVVLRDISVELIVLDSQGNNVADSLEFQNYFPSRENSVASGPLEKIELIRKNRNAGIQYRFRIPDNFQSGIYSFGFKASTGEICNQNKLNKKIIDLSGNSARSVDIPGSSHYKEVCREGEVILEPCAPGRKEVCFQQTTQIGNSRAECRANNWQACLAANEHQENPERLKEECEANTDCYLKNVDIDDDFKFSICVPKNPAHFEADSEISEKLCSILSVNCDTYRGGLFESSTNTKCREAIFGETMNNACISLGDCGAHINVAGEFTDDGVFIEDSPPLGERYVSSLKELVKAVPGQSAQPLTKEEIYAIYNINPQDPNADEKLAELVGLAGAGVYALDYALAYLAGVEGAGAGIANIPYFLGADSLSANAMVVGNALVSAAAGAGIGLLVAKAAGLKGNQALFVGAASGITGGILALSGTGLALSFSFLGPVGLVAGITTGLAYYLGQGEEKRVEFRCMPWQAPAGGKNCKLCGNTEDGLPCNKYKCESLGQTCEFINEGTEEEACVNISPSDSVPPKISENAEVKSDNVEYIEISDSGFKARGNTSDGCLPVYTQVQIGIKTDEAAQCKTDVVNTNSFEEMSGFFGGSNLYKTNHSMSFALPSLASLSSAGINQNERADFNLYVRCQDKNGNANVPQYVINFCLSPEDDKTPPIISEFSPESGSFVRLDATDKKISFYTNEPAECKWSIKDETYELMSNEAFCKNEIGDQTLFGFPCEANLTILGDENNYYFRCKDQPWLEISNPDNKERNANSQSVIYNLKKSQSALTITEIKPSGKILAEGPTRITLEVKTSGGAENGKAICSFGYGNSFSAFLETGESLHKQPEFNVFIEGNYSIPIRCEDVAGNVAEGKAEFTLDFDNDGPLITRVYDTNGVLNVITDENAVCKYVTEESCTNLIGETFDNATEIGGTELKHALQSFKKDLIYTIRCEDNFGNRGSCLQVGGGVY